MPLPEVTNLAQQVKMNPGIRAQFAAAKTANEVATIATNNGFPMAGTDVVRYAINQLSAMSDAQLAGIAGRPGALGDSYTDPNSTRLCAC